VIAKGKVNKVVQSGPTFLKLFFGLFFISLETSILINFYFKSFMNLMISINLTWKLDLLPSIFTGERKQKQQATSQPALHFPIQNLVHSPQYIYQ